MNEDKLPPPKDRVLKMPRQNSVFLAGRLVRNVESAFSPDGALVVTFPMASNETYRVKSGEVKQTTLFVRVRAVGKVAEYVESHFRKADPVLVMGKLMNDERAFRGMSEPAQIVVVQATTVQPLDQETTL